VLDDFLANGEAIKGMKEIIDLSGATMAGAGVVIEKSFQPGAEMLKSLGVEVHALVRISSLENGQINL